MKIRISCAECEQMLSLLNLEELSDINQNIVNNHIASCTRCSSILNTNRETDALLRSLPAIEPLSELPYELQRLWRTEANSPLSDDISAENIYSLQELNGGLRRKSRLSIKRSAAAFLAMIALFIVALFASLPPIMGSYAQMPPSKSLQATPERPNLNSSTQTPSSKPSQVIPEIPSYLRRTSSFLTSYDLLNTGRQGSWGFDNGLCTFDRTGYHIQTEEGISTCFTSSPYFSDFAIEVTMEISQGNSGGIVFLANNIYGEPSYYSFIISSDGTYQLARHTTQNMIMSEGQSSAINIGLNQTNKIATMTQGDQIYLYANSQLLYKGTSSTSRQGAVGFLAMSDDSTLTEVNFTRAIVWA